MWRKAPRQELPQTRSKGCFPPARAATGLSGRQHIYFNGLSASTCMARDWHYRLGPTSWVASDELPVSNSARCAGSLLLCRIVCGGNVAHQGTSPVSRVCGRISSSAMAWLSGSTAPAIRSTTRLSQAVRCKRCWNSSASISAANRSAQLWQRSRGHGHRQSAAVRDRRRHAESTLPPRRWAIPRAWKGGTLLVTPLPSAPTAIIYACVAQELALDRRLSRPKAKARRKSHAACRQSAGCPTAPSSSVRSNSPSTASCQLRLSFAAMPTSRPQAHRCRDQRLYRRAGRRAARSIDGAAHATEEIPAERRRHADRDRAVAGRTGPSRQDRDRRALRRHRHRP